MSLTVGDLRRLLAEADYPDDLPVLVQIGDDALRLDVGMYGLVTPKGELAATSVRRVA